MTFYTVYSITNTVNGKVYIGKHKTEDIHDSYLGSGTAIRLAVKKYGRDKFIKEILFCFDNPKAMDDKERELITLEVLESDQYYNIRPGDGDTELHVIRSSGANNHFYGKKHDEDTRKRMSESYTFRPLVGDIRSAFQKQWTRNQYGANNVMFGKHQTETQRAALLKNHTIRTECDYCKRSFDPGNFKLHHGINCKLNPDRPPQPPGPNTGKKHSADTKERISNRMKGVPYAGKGQKRK